MASSFADFLRGARSDVDRALDRLLPSADAPPARLHEAMRYSVMAGGKRFRPAVVLGVGVTLGAPRDHLLPAAAAIEMIHTFSLIHDDLPALDDDDLRRGRPTCHRAFDEATAVLAGDALLNCAMAVLAREPEVEPERRRRAVELVAIAVHGMIEGQVLDLEAEKAWPEDPEAALREIHRLKTGELLTASARLGGLFSAAGCDVDERLRQFGDAVGLLFQITDDILDVEGDSASLGKTAGKDAAAHKLTYVELFGLHGAKARAREVRSRAEALCGELPGEPALLRGLVAFVGDRDR